MKQHKSILKIATECKIKKGRKIDDKQSFVNTYFISISDGQESNIRSVNKLTKYLSIPRSTRYNLFSTCNSIRKALINKKHNVKCSSVN